MIVYLFLVLLANAHVRMYFSDTTHDLGNRPIRNANAATGDGTFSVAGPCGGAANWGGSSGTQISSVDTGGTVTMKINYNGGHKSDANQFAVRFACGAQGSGPTEEQMKNAPQLDASACQVLQCPVDNQYPCGAPTGNTFAEGYVMSCTVPDSAVSQDCTFSMLDQREWGGCIDVAVGRTVDGVPVYTLVEHAGDYTYMNKNLFLQTTKFEECCCTLTANDEFTIITDDATNTAALSGTVTTICPDHEVFTAYGISGQETVISATLTSTGANSWKGIHNLGGQDFEFTLSGLNLYYSNIDPDAPMICDGYIPRDTGSLTLGSGQVTDNCPQGFINTDGDFVVGSGSGNGSGSDGSSASVGAFPFVVGIAVVMLCLGAYKLSQPPAKSMSSPPARPPVPPRPQKKGLTQEEVLAQVL